MATEVGVVRAILRQKEFLLRRHLVLSRTVLDQLKENGILTEFVRRKIALEPVHKQVPVLLSALENRGLASFRKFLDVLRQTGHSWLVEQLLDTDVTMKRFSFDDIAHRKDEDSRYTRPHARTSGGGGVTGRRRGLDSYFRQTVTAGVPSVGGVDRLSGEGTTLASLLKAKEPPDPQTEPRGIIHARPFITEQGYDPHFGPRMPAGYTQGGQTILPFPRGTEDISRTLYGLNQAFADQEQKHQHAMSVLRQEETAIRQLMEQNARNQGQVRQKMGVVKDISDRLRDINVRATDVYKPSPNPNIGQYRLNQLNQIPWSIDN
ncbi:uncharacterized protein LOC101848063 [Aplysia californica]|uniref:Uncharacterized protein LOC101848063 n=1 Tax=Aplysia californica TaxID=6500 RepID=A0ABM1A7F3_APLCA|nr:uncharacterized protein LOC101848063 [Aplysia californica]